MLAPADGVTWKQFFLALKERFVKDKLMDVAGSVTFFGVLALFPFLLFLVTLAGLLAAGGGILAALVGARSIAAEEQRETLDLVLISPLGGQGLAWAKLMSTFLFSAVVVITALPVFSLVLVFSPVSSRAILIAAAVVFGSVFCGAAIGVAWSAVADPPSSSRLISRMASNTLPMPSGRLRSSSRAASKTRRCACRPAKCAPATICASWWKTPAPSAICCAACTAGTIARSSNRRRS